MILVNFKTYQSGSGGEAVELAEICQEVQKETGVEIISVVQALDLSLVVAKHQPAWLQHLDPSLQGAFTGSINLETALERGAQGVILNHSEKKLPPGKIRQMIKRCRDQKGNFQILVCCRSLTQARKYLKFKPDFLAYEPVELIGGEISVSQAKPGMIENFVELINKKTFPVIGAGIKTAEDIKVGLKLGAKGFLVTSGVVTVKDPKKRLLELAKAFKK